MTGQPVAVAFLLVDMITAKVHGIEELDKALSELPKAVASGVIRTALKKAGQPVADLANVFAGGHVNKGTFAKSFMVHTVLSKRQKRLKKMRGDEKQQATAFVGSTDRKAHLIEFGTAPHLILPKTKRVLADMEQVSGFTGNFALDGTVFGPAVSHPGTPARPTLRPAWDALRDTVVKSIGQEMWAALEKARKRLAKRAAKQGTA